MNSNSTRGRIYAPDAYARAKMLDHSVWGDLLPRLITPSDVDMVIDNRHGFILLCELSRQVSDWKNIKIGQREVYEHLIKDTRHMAVLLSHKIDDGEICTVRDIDSYQTMLHDPQLGFVCNIVLDAQAADQWVRFVQRCFENPDAERFMQLEMIRRRLARENP